ncbi:hypothetical protein D3C80_1273430 [compost metagenome]
MQSLDTLLQFRDPGGWQIRIRCVGALWDIIVFRIISPVKMWFIQLRLIHALSRVVIDRQQLNMSYAKASYVIQPGRDSIWTLGSALCQTKVFPQILGTAIRFNRQITYMKLINNCIQMRYKWRFIIRPTLRISTTQIQNSSLISVYCYRFSIGISRLVPDFTHLDAIRIQHILAVLS